MRKIINDIGSSLLGGTLAILLLALLTPVSVSSQSYAVITGDVNIKFKPDVMLTVDTAQYKVIYDVAFVRDSNNADNKSNGRTVLLTGKNSALYLDYFSALKDSVKMEAISNGASQIEAINKSLAIKGRKFKETIVQDYPQRGKVLVQSFFGGSFRRYIDDSAKQNWTLHNETMEILGYNCRKATCSYRGRDYEAWYTEEIPISRGPHVFTGLPGLILKLKSLDNEYDFSMIGFEKIVKPFVLLVNDNDDIDRVSRDDFRYLEKYYAENAAAAVINSSGPIKMNLTPEEQKELEKRLNRPRPYNPIEKE